MDVFHDRQARGKTTMGWLQAHHTFSFGSFNDPTRMGFRALRVINEDIVAGGSGFSEHAHDHFEILTFMLSGNLEHKDSAGNQGQLKAGDVQLISSGTGISHSERNASENDSVHLFQIWLHGNADDKPPRYQTAHGVLNGASGQQTLIAAPEGPAPLALRAPVRIWMSRGEADTRRSHRLDEGRYGWLQMLEGIAEVQPEDEAETFELRGGDALQLSSVRAVEVKSVVDARWLWFDLD
jgi:redox-sensitive bicupin YhaK (pirin superfamily)